MEMLKFCRKNALQKQNLKEVLVLPVLGLALIIYIFELPYNDPKGVSV